MIILFLLLLAAVLLVLGALSVLGSRQLEINRLRKQVDARDRLIDSLQSLAADAAGDNPLSIQVLDEIRSNRRTPS
jgi:hypothetical protein